MLNVLHGVYIWMELSVCDRCGCGHTRLMFAMDSVFAFLC